MSVLSRGRFLVQRCLTGETRGESRVATRCEREFVVKEQNGFLSALDLTRIVHLETEASPVCESNLSLKRVLGMPKQNSESTFFEILKFWKNKTKEMSKKKDTHSDFFQSELLGRHKRAQSPKPRRRPKKNQQARTLSIRRFSLEKMRTAAAPLQSRKAGTGGGRLARSHSLKKRESEETTRPAEAKWERVLKGNQNIEFVFEQIAQSSGRVQSNDREEASGHRGLRVDGELQQKGDFDREEQLADGAERADAVGNPAGVCRLHGQIPDEAQRGLRVPRWR